MKITLEDREYIAMAVTSVMNEHGLEAVTNLREAWDVLWAAQCLGKLNISKLYDKGYSDDHIETALKKILIGS